ncbi:MAG: dihydroorotate dehydrogenase (quinone), partial [Flavobacteriaceae bacterium]
MYNKLIKPFLFLFDPEAVHDFAFYFIKIFNKIPFIRLILRSIFLINNPKLKRKILGIDFPNPVGLAAGFDKDAKLFNELSNFGFGFIEVGTVTPLKQSGNPKKR